MECDDDDDVVVIVIVVVVVVVVKSDIFMRMRRFVISLMVLDILMFEVWYLDMCKCNFFFFTYLRIFVFDSDMHDRWIRIAVAKGDLIILVIILTYNII